MEYFFLTFSIFIFMYLYYLTLVGEEKSSSPRNKRIKKQEISPKKSPTRLDSDGGDSMSSIEQYLPTVAI